MDEKTMLMRDAFERAIAHADLSKDESGVYTHPMVWQAWAGFCAGWQAAPSQAPAAGSVVVPVEPTEAMIDAAAKTKAMQYVNDCIIHAYMHGLRPFTHTGKLDSPLADAYRAMIAAAKEQK